MSRSERKAERLAFDRAQEARRAQYERNAAKLREPQRSQIRSAKKRGLKKLVTATWGWRAGRSR